jgi:hypothetical protein
MVPNNSGTFNHGPRLMSQHGRERCKITPRRAHTLRIISMKKLVVALLALGAVSVAATSASAAPWHNHHHCGWTHHHHWCR